MGAETNKVLLSLGDRPLLLWCLDVLEQSSQVDRIVVVTRRVDLSVVESLIGKHRITKAKGRIVAGGAERFDSVLAGLNFLASDPPEAVLIHDAARPFLTQQMIRDTLAALSESVGAVAGAPSKDTIKQVDDTQTILATLDRSRIWIVQTPQTFRYRPLLEAYRNYQPPPYPTDDAALLEMCGQRVTMTKGAYDNIKITTPDDLYVAESLLRMKER